MPATAEPRRRQCARACSTDAGRVLLTDRPRMKRPSSRSPRTFTRAFNAGDAKAVAALYTDDAELIDEYGERIQGRPAIQDFYSALFNERKGATIEISVASLRFLGPDVAKEEGRTRVKPAAASPRPTATTRFFM